MEKIFRGIWHRYQPPRQKKLDDVFNRDTGKIIINDNNLKYIGKNNQFNILIDDIEYVEYGTQGSDFINAWIKIKYSINDTNFESYFADGKLFAYSGVFGGTKRIFNNLLRLIPKSKVKRINNKHVYTQIFLLIILIFILLKLIYF